MSAQLHEPDIFNAARLIAPGDERQTYLRAACGDDATLRQRIERLLSAHDQSADFLERPVADLDGRLSAAVAVEPPGTKIGPYTIAEVIGEGGMGVVYRAEQTKPVVRQVALKIIKLGMDSPACLARFEAERQALAMMDHPHIAKVFDAGATHTGRPYFVMELVCGSPITRYCDERQLSVKERLQLVIPVCQAIQHAHQKGIIHRDIKPSNVLVADHDGRPIPKVIDFGVAKAVAPKLDEQTAFTLHGQIIGTLEYMAPEQAEFGSRDIDTRSDIYSLGVLLYELLVGCTPFDKQRFTSAGFQEMLRIIREEEPSRPSTKLSSTDALPSLAAARGVGPGRLAKTIRGELDWIVMKALDKDMNRRYDSASDLALDLERYLGDEPVQACPPSMAYRARKFIRRHKAMLTTAALVLLTLLGATIFSTWQAIRARRAEFLALRNESWALAGEEQAKSAADAEAQERQRAEEYAREVTVQRQMLEQSNRVNTMVTEQILEALKDVSLPEAKRNAALLQVMSRLSDLELTQRIKAFHSAGSQFVLLRDYPSAHKAYAEGLALEPHHVGIIVSRGDLYFREHKFAEAAADYSQAIRQWTQHGAVKGNLNPLSVQLAYARRGLARCWQCEFEQALADFAASYENAPEATLQHLAQSFRGAGLTPAKLDERLHAGVFGLFDRYANEQANSLDALYFCADSLCELKQYDAACPYLTKAISQDPPGCAAHYRLAVLELLCGNHSAYREVCRGALAKAATGTNWNIDPSLNNYALPCVIGPDAVDDYRDTQNEANRCLALRPSSAYCQFVVAATYFRMGDYDEAHRRLAQSLPRTDDNHGEHVFGYYVLAMCCHQLGQADEARRWFGVADQRHKSSPHYNWRFQAQCRLFRQEAALLLGVLHP